GDQHPISADQGRDMKEVEIRGPQWKGDDRQGTDCGRGPHRRLGSHTGRTFLAPKMPSGFTRSTTISNPIAKVLTYRPLTRALARLVSSPSPSPPITAPIVLPSPPTASAMNPLSVRIKPSAK